MKLIVPEEMIPGLKEHLQSEGIPLELAADGDGLKVLHAEEERQLCTTKVLYLKGKIFCPVARSLAEPLGISKKQVGALMNRLEIKIRNCDLGCF